MLLFMLLAYATPRYAADAITLHIFFATLQRYVDDAEHMPRYGVARCYARYCMHSQATQHALLLYAVC